MERLRQGQEGSLSGGTMSVDNEDPGPSRAQGEGGSPGGDEGGPLEPVAPVPGSGSVVDQPSPPDRGLLPSLVLGGGMVEDLREMHTDVHIAPNSGGAGPGVLPSEVGTPRPTRESPMARGSGSSVDGMRHNPPPPPPPPSGTPPTFGLGQLPFGLSSSGSRFLEEGMHSGGARGSPPLGSGESYLNVGIRVSPLFTIEEDVESSGGDTPPEENDTPAFIDGSPDSQGAQEGPGAIRVARETTVTVTEVPSDDESSPDLPRAEASHLVRPGLRGFVGPDNQFSRPSQVWPRSPGVTQEGQVSIDSVLAMADSVSSASNFLTPFEGERRTILKGHPHPPDPNELRNRTNPIHRYRYSQGQPLTPLAGQRNQSSPEQTPPSQRKRVTWAPSTFHPPPIMSKSLPRSPSSRVPPNTLYSLPGSQASIGTRKPTPTPSLDPGPSRTQTSRLRPPTPEEVRAYSIPLSRAPSPSPQVLRNFSPVSPRQPPTSTGPGWPSPRPSSSSISPLGAPSSSLPGRYARPLVSSQPFGAPPTSRGMVRPGSPVGLGPPIARPTRSASTSSPPHPGRGSHHSMLVPTGGYPPTQGAHTRPSILPLHENVPPRRNTLPLPPRGNVIPQRSPTSQATASPQAGASVAQGGSPSQVVVSPRDNVPLRRNTLPLPPRGNVIPQRSPTSQATAPMQEGASAAQGGSLSQVVPSPHLQSSAPPAQEPLPPSQPPSLPPPAQGVTAAKGSRGWRHAVAKKVRKIFKRSQGGEGPAA
ncbi:hypothetical protein HOY80DRAFT_509860 [Tuber brumale]|nr:hypothetical protein HOY80DRAFT_509860 [Tuber brumale]